MNTFKTENVQRTGILNILEAQVQSLTLHNPLSTTKRERHKIFSLKNKIKVPLFLSALKKIPRPW